MYGTELVTTQCPYCGEDIQLVVDLSEPEQRYGEDCQVCCRPMLIALYVDEDGTPSVSVHSEDDV